MVTGRIIGSWALPVAAMMLPACTVRNVDFSKMQRPGRPAQLDAYGDFVGSWTWTARVLNGGGEWSGTATWDWILDQRCLQGRITARSGKTEFDSSGIWSWNPRTSDYEWWMFNSWGYPQAGTATYDPAKKRWVMKYRSTGLDGTRSVGKYEMTFVDKDTLDWRMVEWADPLHLIKKTEMTGTYKRKR